MAEKRFGVWFERMRFASRVCLALLELGCVLLAGGFLMGDGLAWMFCIGLDGRLGWGVFN